MFNNSLKKWFGGGGSNSSNNNNNNSSGVDSGREDSELPAVYSELFFYGRITRQEAEDILKLNGLEEGLYLLRETITPMGNFSLSLVHDNQVLHYSIEKMIDGKYSISEGVPFNDPVSLIKHYQSTKNGFITVPKIACNRVPSQEALAFRGISYKELHIQMKANAQRMNAIMSRAFGPLRESLLMQTLKSMHSSMPWYHGEITRDEGMKRMQLDGHKDGKFLIRSHADGKSFALTVSHENTFRHYYINVTDQENYSLENGCSFKALIILVDHYHNKRDGLSCKLETPVPNPHTSIQTWQNYVSLTANLTQKKGRKVSHGPNLRPPLPIPLEFPVENPPRGAEGGVPSRTAPDPPDENAYILENVYNDIRTDVMSMVLTEDQITLEAKKLGSGQFGDVKKGWCQINNTKVPVAVKTLKNTNAMSEEQHKKREEEILAEAELMKPLDHPNIVRMIGVCKGESIMLVMELAELGPLKKYLEQKRKNNKKMKTWHLLELMSQVCDGMVYLESKDIVHRDLATRNVLLMTEHFAKISDFGLSRIVDDNSEYYVAHCPGRWPLIWYAPECMYYHKFDSKSDVWSFGVTMYEIMAYGAKPYEKKLPAEILTFLECGHRLSQPEGCSGEIYAIMRKCWEFRKENRPSFSELSSELNSLFKQSQQRKE